MAASYHYSIRESFPDWASQKGCYRFLNNEKVSEEALVSEMTQRCSRLCPGRHLVVVQDTTSFNLGAHFRRLKADSGLGPIEDNYHPGFFLHASLVLDFYCDTPLGFADIQLWHRRCGTAQRKKQLPTLPIEQKESYKWLRACANTQRLFSAAASITFVEDRGGDIYEQFAAVPDSRTHLVVRCCQQRRLRGGGLLFSALGSAPVGGTYHLEVRRDARVKRKGRTATLQVRFKKLRLRRSGTTAVKKHLPEAVDLYGVEAREINYRGKDKIHWRLLTTREVGSLEQAFEVVDLYKRRWHIEQLFRLLKKGGFGLEQSELESGWALRRLAVLALGATLRVLQLMYASQPKSQSIDEIFTPREQACLRQVGEQLKGSTNKLANPHLTGTTPWAKWMVARLGGWNGYASQRPAGPITLKRGLDKFTQIFAGWCLALKYCEDVYTP